MSQTSEQALEDAWFEALSLSERCALIELDSLPQTKTERGSLRLKLWRESPAFESSEQFVSRLSLAELTPSELETWLSLDPSHLKTACGSNLPSWLVGLTDRLAQPQSLPSELQDNKYAHYLWVLSDLMPPAIHSIRLECEKGLGSSTPFLKQLLNPLLQRLIALLEPSLILELNIARLREELKGNTSEERHDEFFSRFHQPEGRRSFLLEYPVLSRQAFQLIGFWEKNTRNFLRHWGEAREKALSDFFGSQDLRLESLEAADSDPHLGGRCLYILHFETGRRLVYKPRSLAAASGFQDLLHWLNKRGQEPEFRPLKVMDMGDHGFMEFVEAHDCSRAEEVHHYYQRAGSLIALFYATAATDFHCQNILAAGAHPQVIDLEALFHPVVCELKTDTADEVAQKSLDFSVSNVGILPSPVWNTHTQSLFDLGGLGGIDEEQVLGTGLGLHKVGTDVMRLDESVMTIARSYNRASLQGKPSETRAHSDDIEKGFRHTYGLLLEHRDELLSATGPLAPFEQAEIRLIIRPTRTYSQLLQQAHHPQLLQSCLELERHLDLVWSQFQNQEWRLPLLGEEIRQMLDLDVPYFSSQPGSRDVWGGGGSRTPQHALQSGFELSKERILNFSEAHQEEQVWILRSSLCTTKHRRPYSVPSASTQNALEMAIEVGELLRSRCHWGPDGTASCLAVNKVGSASAEEDVFKPGLIGHDLYDGLPGLILFLAQLAEETGDETLRPLCEGLLKALFARPGVLRVPSLGAFSGWGGYLYLLSHLRFLWKTSHYQELEKKVLEGIQLRLEEEPGLDIISGLAGCLLSLLAHHRVQPQSEAKSLALRCGERILECSSEDEVGASWKDNLMLSGYSHGNSGIAHSLFALAHVCEEDKFRTLALAALKLEESLIDQGRWTDRDQPGQVSQATWCHGSPGMALSRLELCRLFPDSAHRQMAERALSHCYQAPELEGMSLCHGNLGNIEPLLLAAQLWPESVWAERLSNKKTALFRKLQEDGYRSCVPRGIPSPGLMTGLSGVGHALLRLHNPQGVASALTLASPRTTSPQNAG